MNNSMNVPRQLSRRSFLRSSAYAIGAAALTGPLAACTASSGSSAPVKPRTGGTLTVGVPGSSADTLDPNSVTSSGPRSTCLFDTLTYLDGQSITPRMGIAEEIVTKSASLYQLKIRKGVKFHDGRTVTADDVVFSIKRALAGSASVAQLGRLSASGVTKIGPYTVQLSLDAPNSMLADGLWLIYVVPMDFDPKKPIGTGPFVYQSFTAGERSVFTRNRDYWRTGQPYVDTLVMIDFPDSTTMANALLGGQIDVSDVPTSQIAAVKAQAEVLTYPTSNFFTLGMNMSSGPFTDARVRRAFRLLVDREQLVEQVLAGYGKAANDLYAPFDPDFAKDIPAREPDVDQAKHLLKQAGVLDHHFTLSTSQTVPNIVSYGTTIAEQLTGNGVKVTVDVLDPSVYFGPQYSTRPLSTGFWPGTSIGAQTWLSLSPGAAYNQTHWSDQEFTQLFAAACAQTDQDKRRSILHDLQEVWYDRGTYLIAAYPQSSVGYRHRVGGIRPQGATLVQDYASIWVAD